MNLSQVLRIVDMNSYVKILDVRDYENNTCFELNKFVEIDEELGPLDVVGLSAGRLEGKPLLIIEVSILHGRKL